MRVLVRYCFGGAIAGRLGSTDLVNTIVIAHPSNLKPAQIRAIKVNLPRMVCHSRDFTYVSPQVPSSWALAEGKNISIFFFVVHYIFYYTSQMTTASKIKMLRPPKAYSRSRRRNLIMLTMSSRFIRVNFFWRWGHVLLIQMMHRDSSWFRYAAEFDGSRGQGGIRRCP
jgi:hypothetical protein